MYVSVQEALILEYVAFQLCSAAVQSLPSPSEYGGVWYKAAYNFFSISLQLVRQLSQQPKEPKMANVVIGKIEVALEDVAHWLSKAQALLIKGPAVIASLGTLFVAVDKVLSDATTDLSNPLGLVNIPMDVQQFTDLKAVWADIKAAMATAGVKI
jgi:hypothetical protein